MYLLGSLLSACILGGICAYIAWQQGRQPVTWFIAGFLLGVIGLLVLFLLPRKQNLGLPPIAATAAAHPQGSSQLEQPSIPAATLPTSSPNKLWYFLDEDNKQYGPMSFDALKKAWSEQTVTDKTYVWNETMNEWKTIEALSELHAELNPEA